MHFLSDTFATVSALSFAPRKCPYGKKAILEFFLEILVVNWVIGNQFWTLFIQNHISLFIHLVVIQLHKVDKTEMRGELSPVYFLWNYLCCIVNYDFPVWGNYTFWLMFVWPDSLTSFWLEPCSTLESPWTRTTVSPPPTLVQPTRKASSPREGVIGRESGVLFSFFFFFFPLVGGSWGGWRGNSRISTWKLLSPSPA